MAINFASIPENLKTAMTTAAATQPVGNNNGELTDKAISRGINLFKMSDYEDSLTLVYIPRTASVIVNGKAIKGHTKIVRHELRALGMSRDDRGSYRGNIRSTKDIASGQVELAEWYAANGVSGTAEALQAYRTKSSEYVRARAELEMATKYGTIDRKAIDEADFKDAWRHAYAYAPIGEEDVSYWFPVVVIKPEVKNGTVLPVPAFTTQEDGSKAPTFEIAWYRASDNVFNGKLPGAAKVLLLGDEDTYEGNLFTFDYTIRDEVREKSKKTGRTVSSTMLSGQSLNITVVQETPQMAPVFEILKPYFEQWDAEVQEKYNTFTILEDIRSAEILTDEEVKLQLDGLFGGIDEAIEAIKVRRDALLGKDVDTSDANLASQLGIGDAPQPTAGALPAGNPELDIELDV